ncbi:MAG TPA: EF-hand domain-containing protein [Geminicoccaceae bacterium]|nr:EF-hand domain-containing protein [Geminicoccaceae bacterium]
MRFSIPRWRSLLTAGVAAGAVLGSPSAMAQQAEREFSAEEIAFMAADTDGDGVVSEAELARDAARGFATLDKDGDGKLSPGELGPHDPAPFRRVDADGDGVLTFTEVMANKSRAFTAGDKDQDGGLSFEEMVEVVESEAGGAS